MQKVFILVLLLSVLHRPSAYILKLKSNPMMSTTSCTVATPVTVKTDEYAINFAPNHVYKVSVCLVYKSVESSNLRRCTPGTLQTHPTVFRLDMKSGTSTVTMKHLEDSMFVPTNNAMNGDTEECKVFSVDDIIGVFAGVEFSNVKVTATVTALTNLGAGSVTAELRSAGFDFMEAKVYKPIVMAAYSTYSFTCRTLVKCQFTHAVTSGTFTPGTAKYLTIDPVNAPVAAAGPTPAVGATTFMVQDFMCGAADCTVAFTVSAAN